MCSELLSIIIPVHNTAQYLKRTLNILECQVFRNFEIIIINDNSSDDTEKIVLSFQKEYKIL
jgi:glycosyltransferase involved in cell wall biosynthesis